MGDQALTTWPIHEVPLELCGWSGAIGRASPAASIHLGAWPNQMKLSAMLGETHRAYLSLVVRQAP